MRLLLIVMLAATALAQEKLQVPAPPPPPPSGQERALLEEYFQVQTDANIARMQAQSYRVSTVRWDGKQEVRTESEFSCPDSSHMQVFRDGRLTTDFYRVNGIEYRFSNGRWSSRQGPKTGSGGCETGPQLRRSIMMMQRYRDRMASDVDGQASTYKVSKGSVTTVRGTKCQEWQVVRTFRYDPSLGYKQTGDQESPYFYCFALSDHHYVESRVPWPDSEHMTVTTNYDWNKPIEIKPPQ